MRVTAKF